MWAIVAGMVKNYNLDINTVLYEMTYTNMQMYSAVIPTYGDKTKDKGKVKGKAINASDPRNRDEVHKILFG